MRPDRWLVIRDAPGQPLVVLGVAAEYRQALAMFAEACRASGACDHMRLIPHPDAVADVLLAPDASDEGDQKPALTGKGEPNRWRRITALALMQMAARLGAEFWLAGPDDLRVRIPLDFPLTPAIQAAMRYHEPELLELARQGYRDMLWREVLRRPGDAAVA